MSNQVAPVTLSADDAVELGELLEFLGDWLHQHRDELTISYRRFTLGLLCLDELSSDLARFAFLLGGDGHRYINGPDNDDGLDE
jgi:hypothetical protein